METLNFYDNAQSSEDSESEKEQVCIVKKFSKQLRIEFKK